jgi:hypothetical protein
MNAWRCPSRPHARSGPWHRRRGRLRARLQSEDAKEFLNIQLGLRPKLGYKPKLVEHQKREDNPARVAAMYSKSVSRRRVKGALSHDRP